MARTLKLTEVGVYVVDGGEQAQSTYGTLCAAGEWIASDGFPPPGNLQVCNNTGCLCTWEGDGQLRPAEVREARSWFGAMQRLSDQGTIERERDL